MKKWIKITGITAAVCIGAGLICFVSGVFAGAKSGVFISRRGIELEGSAYSDERYGISQIKDIEIETDDAKVEIKPSQDDTFGYSVTYEDTHSTPQVTVDNGKIRIEEKTSGGFWILDFGFAALFENRENAAFPARIERLQGKKCGSTCGISRILNAANANSHWERQLL